MRTETFGRESSRADEFYDEDGLSDLIQQYAPEHIRTDQELMRSACETDYAVLGLLKPRAAAEPGYPPNRD